MLVHLVHKVYRVCRTPHGLAAVTSGRMEKPRHYSMALASIRETNIMTGKGLTLFATLLLLISYGATAEIYRWVDAQGQVHFADREHLPAAAKATETVEVKPNVVKACCGGTTSPVHKTVRLPGSSATVVSRPRTSRKAPQRDRLCELAKKKLERIRSRMRAGYSASQQSYLHDQELKYMDERHRYCD